MTGKTHKAVGVCVGVAFTFWGIRTTNNPVFAISTLASAAGAMLPDIDHDSSRLGSRRKWVVNAAVRLISVLFGLVALAFCVTLAVTGAYRQLVELLLLIILPVIVLSILAQVPFVRKALKFASKHRGIMHTLAVPSLLCLGFMRIANDAVRFGLLAMAAGYLSHLALDCLNKRGCPILWPILRKNISLLPIKTGSVWEYVVSYALAGVLLVVVISGVSFRGITGLGQGSENGSKTLEPVINDLQAILVWYDTCAGYYEGALSAVSSYVSNPAAQSLSQAETACESAVRDIGGMQELSHSLDDKTIRGMKSLQIDFADFSALFNSQAFTKNDYATGIEMLLFYLDQVPALNTQLERLLEQKRSLEVVFRKIDYLGVNHLLAEVPESDIQDFKEDFLPGLQTFSVASLPWETDKGVLDAKADALFIEAERVIDAYADFVSEEYRKLLEDREDYVNFLMEHGYTREEAEERVEENLRGQ